VGLQGIDEIQPDGSVVAAAAMSLANWSMRNASSPDTFDMSYAAHVAVRSVGVNSAVVGSVDVRMDYVLPAYRDSSPTNLAAVTAQLLISNWTWQGAGDRLAVQVPLSPTDPATEHLSAPSPAGTLVSSVDNATGIVREYFQIAELANATSTVGTQISVAVVPSLAILPGIGTVALTIGTGAGEFRSIVYDAEMGIPLPASVAGIPIYEFALVGLGATVISILVAAGARSIRRRPSDLMYVEEEG